MRPRVGAMNCVSRLKKVVLPAPFGPISACMLPRFTFKSTSFTATKPLNSLVSPRVSRMYSADTRERLFHALDGHHFHAGDRLPRTIRFRNEGVRESELRQIGR